MSEPQIDLSRITARPDTLGGKSCIRDTRVPVELILRHLACGMEPEQLCAEHPTLEPEDIRAALAYAYTVLAHDSLDTVRVG